MTRILIAEDDPRISSFIEKGLRANGFSTTVAADGEWAQSLGLTGEFDLLILDMGLPGKDGYQVLQEIRAQERFLPVLVLTGRPELRDAVACLDIGADDYMTKPFHFEELLARVRARLRPPGPTDTHVLEAGGIRLDLRTRRATVRDEEIELAGRQFALLETFLRHPGQVLSREQILSHVWGYSFDPGTNIVNVYVASLRKRFGDDVVETIRGAGYRYRGPGGAAAANGSVGTGAEPEQAAGEAAPALSLDVELALEAGAAASEARHVLFVPTPGGYRLLERQGPPPEPGTELGVGEAEERFVVSKVGASPLPADSRGCAYLQRR